MKLTLQTLKQLIEEVAETEKEYYITFIGGITRDGAIKLVRYTDPSGRSLSANLKDMRVGGRELEDLLREWQNLGVGEDVLQWYRDAVEKLKTLNVPDNIWYDIKYTPSTGEITVAQRGLPYLEEKIIKK